MSNQIETKGAPFSGSYAPEDVIFLLKNLNGLIQETELHERERMIQSGGHYSEMLPVEYQPDEAYLNLFYQTLELSANKVALAVGKVSELILKQKGNSVVLVSLARAGTPMGILIKRYLHKFYGLNLPHFSISIIRGKGIDENAILYIKRNYPKAKIQFIDGWTGKGVITKVLTQACQSFYDRYNIELDDDLAVLADPGYCVTTFGTREDFLIPSACLNSTVSGLVSRTVCREDLIGRQEYHGVKYYAELAEYDLSRYFVDTITRRFDAVFAEAKLQAAAHQNSDITATWKGLADIESIRQEFHIEDVNMIKPGVGETTRVLLRRVPWKILVNKRENPNLRHILLLAQNKGVPVEEHRELTYSCCGIVKELKEI